MKFLTVTLLLNQLRREFQRQKKDGDLKDGGRVSGNNGTNPHRARSYEWLSDARIILQLVRFTQLKITCLTLLVVKHD
jgi:hypothetical protein